MHENHNIRLGFVDIGFEASVKIAVCGADVDPVGLARHHRKIRNDRQRERIANEQHFERVAGFPVGYLKQRPVPVRNRLIDAEPIIVLCVEYFSSSS